MIKLKSLLLENDYIGTVTSYGSVHGISVLDDDVIHPETNLPAGDRWRYYKKSNEVIWTTEPLSMDLIHSVNNFLFTKGITPNFHYYANDELWNKTEG